MKNSKKERLKSDKKDTKLKRSDKTQTDNKKKKKLSIRLKRANIILIFALIILISVLSVILLKLLFKEIPYYQIESRENQILESRKNDTSDFETIGWVRLQGTNIDYPLYGVIQNSFKYPVTNSYLWSLNNDSDFHNVMIVYGHNIMNLGPQPIKHDETFIRMEELMAFVYKDFAEENKYVQLTINGEDYLYKIFAVNFMPVADLNEYPDGEFLQVDRNSYVERLLSESIYDFDVDLVDGDRILSVVTCSRFFEDGLNYDFIVTGRMVRPDEKIENYKVSRNKNYEQIEDKLKGDEENENAFENA